MSFRTKTPWDPDWAATKRVKDALPYPTVCRYCGYAVKCVLNSEVYGVQYGHWPYVYACQQCDAYVGLHHLTAVPLGTLANQQLRNLRVSSKALFHKYIAKKGLSRTAGYLWLAEFLGIEHSNCHFGWFDINECLAIIRLLE